jgi:hypothetical protein
MCICNGEAGETGDIVDTGGDFGGFDGGGFGNFT